MRDLAQCLRVGLDAGHRGVDELADRACEFAAFLRRELGRVGNAGRGLGHLYWSQSLAACRVTIICIPLLTPASSLALAACSIDSMSCQRPLNTGVRFSMNAFGPSCASSLAKTSH